MENSAFRGQTKELVFELFYQILKEDILDYRVGLIFNIMQSLQTLYFSFDP